MQCKERIQIWSELSFASQLLKHKSLSQVLGAPYVPLGYNASAAGHCLLSTGLSNIENKTDF